jgi:hypothetical protein
MVLPFDARGEDRTATSGRLTVVPVISAVEFLITLDPLQAPIFSF